MTHRVKGPSLRLPSGGRTPSPFEGLALTAAMTTFACTPAPAPSPSLLPFDQRAWATTHNSMSAASDGWLVPSQEHGELRQLADGVRGMMLDVHEQDGEAWLCHGYCELGSQPLVEGLAELYGHLALHPDVVLTLILENYVSAELLEEAFAASGLLELCSEQQAGEPWPSVAELIASGERVVVLSDHEGGARPWLLPTWEHAWETHWSAESLDDFDCEPNRGDPDNELFILNHFLTDPVSLPELAAEANQAAVLERRAFDCWEQSGRIPNFVAVDFYATGDLMVVVEALNRAEEP
jgi:hypothetical protein